MRILLADDHGLVRDSIAAILTSSGFDDVVKAGTLEEALQFMRVSPVPSLALIDYDMPGMNGLSGLEQLVAESGDNPVALMSGVATFSVAERALKVGAAGFVPKTLPARTLVAAVRFMLSGEVFVPIEFMREGRERSSSMLSQRESEVLRGICDGKSNKEIARDLGLQEVTIKLHVKTLSRKLDARNRTHAAMIGRDRALI